MLIIRYSMLDARCSIMHVVSGHIFSFIEYPESSIEYRKSSIENPVSVPNVEKTNIELNFCNIILLSSNKERVNHELSSNGANQTTF